MDDLEWDELEQSIYRKSDWANYLVYKMLVRPKIDLELPEVKPYITSIDAAVSVVRLYVDDLTWFHMSHLECYIIPTVPHPDGVPMCNAAKYYANGRPMKYVGYNFSGFDGVAPSILLALIAYLRNKPAPEPMRIR